MKRTAVIGAALFLSIVPALAWAAEGDGAIEYNRDVRPILAENCFSCHGPDSASRKADLRLDQRDPAIKAGALTPGDLAGSELIQRIQSEERDEVMPPLATKKTLTAEQKQILKRWVESGAEYQPHWSLIAPTRPEPPVVKNEAWVRNPIDRFVLAKLEASGLAPAPEADRRTLARRLSLDLTGLPPSPAVVEAFLRDPAPDAYERFVDQMMASAHWGEHRGRYWLDAARYADTHGIHFDNYREMWTYRDWVIKAFNRNLPFDQFTVEQLAGDLLPNPTLDQQVASGFNRCNITTNEGGLIDEEYLVLYTRDRTETTSLVWLGMTTGCAVCHDHKFDPISQKEFYSLAAFFNNTTQIARDGNIKDTPPIVIVPLPADRPRAKEIAGKLVEARQQADARKPAARPEFDQWLGSTSAVALASLIPSDGLRFHAYLGEGSGKTLFVAVDGRPKTLTVPSAAWGAGHLSAKAFKSQAAGVAQVPEAGNFDKGQPFSYGAWVKIPKASATGAFMARMDDAHDHRGWDLWFENGRIGTHIIHQWPGNAIKVLANTQPKSGEWAHLLVTYDGSGKAAGVTLYLNGQRQEHEVQADTLTESIQTTVPLKLGQRHSTSVLANLLIQDVRIYGRALPAEEVDRLAKTSRATWLVDASHPKRTSAENDELFSWWLPSFDLEYGKLAATLAGLEQENAAIQARATVAHVMNERKDEAMAYILFRGEYDKRRDKVTPETPAVLPPMPADLPRNRLGLAQWLLRAEHPLTARVTVNRFWQEVFGTGLVRTTGDFGVTGETPSHPELLDWLALDFRERGWDVKSFFKTLVTSAAYRQSALVSPEKLAKDPANRMLSRGPRFRMDAEMVRDYALAASGLMVDTLGGPSVKPYQPEGVWEAVAMIGSNTRDYARDAGAKLYRRSLYTFWKRAAPPASMDIFNAPSREVCTVRRERTNTPLQALVTLNDPQFIESARNLAQLAIKGGGTSVETRAEFMAMRLLARPLRPEEGQVIQNAFEELFAYYQEHPKDATELITVGESKPDSGLDPAALAAWTMTANELMNLDEVLNK
ncbi:Planctomycete cytochrome C [Singulisphaera sp. GP187]|uniref:DUF1553 domain-containing protein n=1 Tax=Singulisphaera sp. GP187 TaxID=1882752 RepID=UPI000927AE84|nr:DUF1553 domain-containing protein [Singulisphaera sp. GP187]SIO66874.1 Planctomycete cytochrome C [Singulisphaera sp. GP187]